MLARADPAAAPPAPSLREFRTRQSLRMQVVWSLAELGRPSDALGELRRALQDVKSFGRRRAGAIVAEEACRVRMRVAHLLAERQRFAAAVTLLRRARRALGAARRSRPSSLRLLRTYAAVTHSLAEVETRRRRFGAAMRLFSALLRQLGEIADRPPLSLARQRLLADAYEGLARVGEAAGAVEVEVFALLGGISVLRTLEAVAPEPRNLERIGDLLARLASACVEEHPKEALAAWEEALAIELDLRRAGSDYADLRERTIELRSEIAWTRYGLEDDVGAWLAFRASLREAEALAEDRRFHEDPLDTPEERRERAGALAGLVVGVCQGLVAVLANSRAPDSDLERRARPIAERGRRVLRRLRGVGLLGVRDVVPLYRRLDAIGRGNWSD